MLIAPAKNQERQYAVEKRVAKVETADIIRELPLQYHGGKYRLDRLPDQRRAKPHDQQPDGLRQPQEQAVQPCEGGRQKEQDCQNLEERKHGPSR